MTDTAREILGSVKEPEHYTWKRYWGNGERLYTLTNTETVGVYILNRKFHAQKRSSDGTIEVRTQMGWFTPSTLGGGYEFTTERTSFTVEDVTVIASAMRAIMVREQHNIIRRAQ